MTVITNIYWVPGINLSNKYLLSFYEVPGTATSTENIASPWSLQLIAGDHMPGPTVTPPGPQATLWCMYCYNLQSVQESERLSDLPNMPWLESGVEPGPELPRILWPAGS